MTGPAHRAGRVDRDDLAGDEPIEQMAQGGELLLDDADRLLRPQRRDEPALLLGARGEAMGRLDRQQAHRRRPPAALFSAAGA